MDNRANQEIRKTLRHYLVTQDMLAENMGIARSTLSRMLSVECDESVKKAIESRIIMIARNKFACVEEEANNAHNDAENVATKEETEDVAVQEETENADTHKDTKFQIGDRVKVASRHSIIGTVADIWHSHAHDSSMYAVDLENGSRGLYAEDKLEPAPIPITYSWEAHIDGNVAVVTMNATQGEKTWVHSRGHAHILHDGEVGMAQAVSYAARRMFEALDANQKDRIYLNRENKNA